MACVASRRAGRRLLPAWGGVVAARPRPGKRLGHSAAVFAAFLVVSAAGPASAFELFGMRFFERRWPLEKTANDELVSVDRVYTMLNKLGIIPLAVFIVTYPITQEIEPA